MKLLYDQFDITSLGEVEIKQTRTMDGPDQPQRARVELGVRVHLFQRTYDENRSRIEALRKALATPNAVLQWTNDVAGTDYVRQTATLKEDDLPDAWGEYHQEVNLTFQYYEQSASGAPNNIPLTFLPENTTQAIQFEVVRKWQHSASVEHFNPLRKHRKATTGKIRVEGVFLAAGTQPLEARRAALEGRAAEFRKSLNCAEGLLRFGRDGSVFTGAVRVEEFTCDIDQLIHEAAFAFTASYVMHPDTADYATVEMTAAERDDFNGQLALHVTGKIQAQTETAARAKLAALLATVIAAQGYQDGQPMTLETTPASISANADGDTFTELTFSASYRKWKATNLRPAFKRARGSKPVDMGEMVEWTDHYSSRRMHEQRSQRRLASGSLEAKGTFKADMALTLGQRREQLLRAQRALKAEIAAEADGTLTYGDWSQVVRVEDFQARINSAESGIDWTLSASYSLFPLEGGYATVEYTVALRKAIEEGDEFLGFNGRIGATDAATAAAKLNMVRTAMLKSHGWTLAQRIRDESTLQHLSSNGDRTTGLTEGEDGETFVEQSFAEEYRRRIPGDIQTSVLRMETREDAPTQTVITTYAGSVTATGATFEAAYASALARARELGANREASIAPDAWCKSSTTGFDQRQLQAGGVVEFLRLSFSYEYQSKMAAGRAVIEMASAVNREMFGVDVETCSGHVAARDEETARAIYESQIRPVYVTRIIQTEQTGVSETRNQTGEGWNTQHVRLEFSLQALTAKPSGSVTMSYTVDVARDCLTLELRTAVQGTCHASDHAAATAAVTVFLASLNFGKPVRARNTQDWRRSGSAGMLVKLDFEEEYVGRVTGQAGVIEMSLTERLVYSGTRWVTQAVPFTSISANGTGGIGGVSIMQPTGIEPGSRTVSGWVTAATKATAEAWAWKQKAMLTGDRSGKVYAHPPQIETEYAFVPRIDGVAKGSKQNVRIHKVVFQFAEALPNYPAP